MPPLASLLATLAVAPLLLRRSAVLLGGGASVLLKPACTRADDAGALARLEATLVNIQTVLDRWDDFTIECNYAEADREMMQNKTKLLEKASVKGAYMKDKSVVRNLCKINTRRLNTYYAADGPPQKSVKLLSSPELTDRVEDLEEDELRRLFVYRPIRLGEPVKHHGGELRAGPALPRLRRRAPLPPALSRGERRRLPSGWECSGAFSGGSCVRVCREAPPRCDVYAQDCADPADGCAPTFDPETEEPITVCREAGPRAQRQQRHLFFRAF